MNQPTAFDWTNLIVGAIGSIGTIAALLFAVKVWREETIRTRNEADRRDAEAADRHAEQVRWQAERVAATIAVEREPAVWPLEAPKRHFSHATVHNESGLPIYDVRVLVLHEDGQTYACPVNFVPPGGTGHVHLKPRSSPKVNGLPLALTFRDASERWWQKCHDGHLTMLPGDPHPPPPGKRRPENTPDPDGAHSVHAPEMRVEAGELFADDLSD